MKLRISPTVLSDYPKCLLGVIIAKNVNNSRRISAVQQLVRGAAAAKMKEIQKNGEPQSLAEWRKIQQAPSRIEEILNEVKNGDPYPTGTVIEDAILYFSIRSELPARSDDLDEVCGDIELTYSEGTEPFRKKADTKIQHPENNEMIYRDKAGVLCRFLNAAECERTALVPNTKNILITLENPGIMPAEKMKEILKEAGALIQRYCGGTIEIHMLGDRVSEVDLGITGRTGITDADFKPIPKRLEFHEQLAAKYANEKATKEGNKKAVKKSEATEKKVAPQPVKQKVKKPETPKKEKKSHAPVLTENLKDILTSAVKKAFQLKGELPAFSIENPKDESHGDYASNIAMVLTKTLQRPPQEIAREILDHLEKPQYLESAQFAPPGFINFTLADKWLKNIAPQVIKGEEPYDHITYGADQKVIVEYSSPNIAKPLGVHHLLSTIIGQTLCNIHKYLGYETISINHIGDWGTQFGKLIIAYEKWGDKKKVEKNPIDELLALYVKFHEEAEKDQALEDQARAVFKKLEEGDEKIHKLWQWTVDLSLKDIQKTYDALGGIHFDHTQGESFYEDKMQSILDEGIRKKIFTEGEGGSLIVKFEDEDAVKLPPLLVRKSDGATLYATRDIAQMKYRIQKWHPEKILYVVDVAQSLHFQQLIETMKLFGERETELVHVSFGRMRFADKNMSTRKGNILRLNEVLAEAVERAKKLIQEKEGNSGKKSHMLLAQAIGIGAVKYNVLSQNRITDIVFDWDKMLALEGNSAPYLQYTFARAQSILRKADSEKTPAKISKKKNEEAQSNLFEAIESVEKKSASPEHERAVLRKLLQFPEVLFRSAEEYKTNLLCQYLFELAQAFNSFYHTTPVLQAETAELQKERLQTVQAVALTIQRGLNILGIQAPEKM